jgi:hypothetical protein
MGSGELEGMDPPPFASVASGNRHKVSHRAWRDAETFIEEAP